MKSILISIMAIFYSTLVFSQTTGNQTISSLSDCVNYGLANHHSLVVSENNVQIAKQKANLSLSGYLPQINTSITFVDNFKLPVTIIPVGTLGPTQKTPIEAQLGSNFNTNIGIDFGQAIYDQSRIYGIMANTPMIEISELQKEQNKENLIYSISVAYFQVLISKELKNSLQNNKQKYKELLNVIETQLKHGVALQKDFDRVSVNLNNTNYQIDDATIKEQLALNQLKNYMGMPPSQELMINDTLDYAKFIYTPVSKTLEISNLYEYRLSEKQIELQKLNVKAKRATTLPTISVFGKYGYQALNNNFRDAFSKWQNYSYIGISISKPLLSFKHRSIAKEEKLKLMNDIENFNMNQENLTLRFENAKTSGSTAYTAFLAAKENMNLAKNLVDITYFQYQKGVVTLTDYLNDDYAYKTAQSNYINSLYNVLITQLNIQKAQGTLQSFLTQIK